MMSYHKILKYFKILSVETAPDLNIKLPELLALMKETIILVIFGFKTWDYELLLTLKLLCIPPSRKCCVLFAAKMFYIKTVSH